MIKKSQSEVVPCPHITLTLTRILVIGTRSCQRETQSHNWFSWELHLLVGTCKRGKAAENRGGGAARVAAAAAVDALSRKRRSLETFALPSAPPTSTQLSVSSTSHSNSIPNGENLEQTKSDSSPTRHLGAIHPIPLLLSSSICDKAILVCSQPRASAARKLQFARYWFI